MTSLTRAFLKPSLPALAGMPSDPEHPASYTTKNHLDSESSQHRETT